MAFFKSKKANKIKKFNEIFNSTTAPILSENELIPIPKTDEKNFKQFEKFIFSYAKGNKFDNFLIFGRARFNLFVKKYNNFYKTVNDIYKNFDCENVKKINEILKDAEEFAKKKFNFTPNIKCLDEYNKSKNIPKSFKEEYNKLAGAFNSNKKDFKDLKHKLEAKIYGGDDDDKEFLEKFKAGFKRIDECVKELEFMRQRMIIFNKTLEKKNSGIQIGDFFKALSNLINNLTQLKYKVYYPLLNKTKTNIIDGTEQSSVEFNAEASITTLLEIFHSTKQVIKNSLRIVDGRAINFKEIILIDQQIKLQNKSFNGVNDLLDKLNNTDNLKENNDAIVFNKIRKNQEFFEEVITRIPETLKSCRRMYKWIKDAEIKGNIFAKLRLLYDNNKKEIEQIIAIATLINKAIKVVL